MVKTQETPWSEPQLALLHGGGSVVVLPGPLPVPGSNSSLGQFRGMDMQCWGWKDDSNGSCHLLGTYCIPGVLRR